MLLFDVETVPELANPAILEWLELQINLAPSQPRWGKYKFSSGKFSAILQKSKCHL